LINALQLHRITPKEAPGVTSPRLRMHDALPFMWVAGLFFLNNRIDIIMLGTLKGAHAVGVYSIASRAAELTSFLMGAANMVLAPKIAHLYHTGQLKLMQRMVSKAARNVLILSIPIAAILILGAAPLITYFYGQKFAGGAIVLQTLAAAQIMTVGSGPLGTLLNMTGHTKANTQNMALAVTLNVVLNLALIPLFGATGAAIATGISLVFSRILLWYWVRRHLGIHPTGLSL
jgi:O-antigen/teichoic acid export membrane protein